MASEGVACGGATDKPLPGILPVVAGSHTQEAERSILHGSFPLPRGQAVWYGGPAGRWRRPAPW
jgi:hypothetical protein